jgi:hypothetical protein
MQAVSLLVAAAGYSRGVSHFKTDEHKMVDLNNNPFHTICKKEMQLNLPH